MKRQRNKGEYEHKKHHQEPFSWRFFLLAPRHIRRRKSLRQVVRRCKSHPVKKLAPESTIGLGRAAAQNTQLQHPPGAKRLSPLFRCRSKTTTPRGKHRLLDRKADDGCRFVGQPFLRGKNTRSILSKQPSQISAISTRATSNSKFAVCNRFAEHFPRIALRTVLAGSACEDVFLLPLPRYKCTAQRCKTCAPQWLQRSRSAMTIFSRSLFRSYSQGYRRIGVSAQQKSPEPYAIVHGWPVLLKAIGSRSRSQASPSTPNPCLVFQRAEHLLRAPIQTHTITVPAILASMAPGKNYLAVLGKTVSSNLSFAPFDAHRGNNVWGTERASTSLQVLSRRRTSI